MRKLLMLSMLVSMFAQVASAYSLREYSSEARSSTGRYAFNYLALSYYDHYHAAEGKEKNLLVQFPLLNLGFMAADPFFTLNGNTIEETGVRFPIALPNKLRLEPWVFKNNELESYGWGVTAVLRLR